MQVWGNGEAVQKMPQKAIGETIAKKEPGGKTCPGREKYLAEPTVPMPTPLDREHECCRLICK